MISSVIYTPLASRVGDGSTFNPSKSPLFQIVILKVAVVILTFILGDILPQLIATIVIAMLAAIEFWVTKNLGRVYLQAGWSINTQEQEDVWIYEANFKSPSQFEEVFWYSQIIYGVLLIVMLVIILSAGKFSLASALVIAFAANYVNFFAFGKIIALRNSGVLQKIADEVNATGEVRQTIKLPLVHRSKMGDMNSSNVIQSSNLRAMR